MKSTQIFNIVSFELPIKLDDQLDSISGNRFLQANFIIFSSDLASSRLSEWIYWSILEFS